KAPEPKKEEVKNTVVVKKAPEPKKEAKKTVQVNQEAIRKSHQQVKKEQEELSRKISKLIKDKLDDQYTEVEIRNINEPVKSTFVSSKKSYIHASKIISVEIDGKRHLKLTLLNSKNVITLPIYKAYKSGKKIVYVILTIDDKTTKNEFIVSTEKAESDLMLGEEFIIKNYIK
ncbi:MAG: hypothetical protein NE330_17200, partial [Lentisphaeraceae bacterium]|nr:hypothetical protein [Lentisphaeraceae bacterium]